MISVVVTGFYLAAGEFWWRRIVVPGPVRYEPEKSRLELANAAMRGDVALLIAKGTFILLWPMALFSGWLMARASR